MSLWILLISALFSLFTTACANSCGEKKREPASTASSVTAVDGGLKPPLRFATPFQPGSLPTSAALAETD